MLYSERLMPYRIAIIGYGKIAVDQHVPAIQAEPRFELAAIVSQTGQSHPDVPTFENHGACVTEAKRIGIDAVAICTPPSVRYEIARDCIAAGLHTLLEKPPGATVGEVEALLVLAKDAGVTLFTSWHAQENPAVTAAVTLLHERRIRTMRIVWREDVRKWHPGQEWIWEPGGFGVFDAGINALSIARLIFPEILIVQDAELLSPANGQTPIAGRLMLASPAADGPIEAEFDWRHDGVESWTIRVDTTDGERIELRDGGARLFRNDREIAAPGPGEYPQIYRRFGNLIDDGTSHVDLAPLRRTADAFLLARRIIVAPFDA